MQIDSDILRYIKRRLHENASAATIKTEIKENFREISEDAKADVYIEVAKKDAPKLIRFEKLTAQRAKADHIQLTAYAEENGNQYVRTITLAEFQAELPNFRSQYQIDTLLQALTEKPAREVDILPKGKIDTFIVRSLGLI